MSNVINFFEHKEKRLTTAFNDADNMIEKLQAQIRLDEMTVSQAVMILVNTQKERNEP